MFVVQPIHIVIIIVVGALLLFGGSKLPEIGRSLGKSISEFRKGTKEAAEGFKEEVSKPADRPAQAAPVASAPAGGNFCIQCGSPNPAGAHFCANCGAKLPEKAG